MNRTLSFQGMYELDSPSMVVIIWCSMVTHFSPLYLHRQLGLSHTFKPSARNEQVATRRKKKKKTPGVWLTHKSGCCLTNPIAPFGISLARTHRVTKLSHSCRRYVHVTVELRAGCFEGYYHRFNRTWRLTKNMRSRFTFSPKPFFFLLGRFNCLEKWQLLFSTYARRVYNNQVHILCVLNIPFRRYLLLQEVIPLWCTALCCWLLLDSAMFQLHSKLNLSEMADLLVSAVVATITLATEKEWLVRPEQLTIEAHSLCQRLELFSWNNIPINKDSHLNLANHPSSSRLKRVTLETTWKEPKRSCVSLIRGIHHLTTSKKKKKKSLVLLLRSGRSNF